MRKIIGLLVFGLMFTLSNGVSAQEAIVGDANCDGEINLLDIDAFQACLLSGEYDFKCDINQDQLVDLRDIAPFLELMTHPKGDVNRDQAVDLLDVNPFIEVLNTKPKGPYEWMADMNGDGDNDLLDVQLFVNAVTG